ncbi:MAG: carbohydrate ABC transporter permease [Desulfobacterales bacterium]|nr:carbohydrate ABC transporter permease [Desulfobacterales bacterium]
MKQRMSLPERVVVYGLLAAVAVLFVTPFIQMVSISLATENTNEQLRFTLFPSEAEVSNYAHVLTNPAIGFARSFWNSVWFVTLAIVGQLFSATLVGYAFARIRAVGREVLFVVLLSTLIIPFEMLLLPQFIIFRNLGLVNTLWPIVIPNYLGTAFNIFLVRQFISAVPRALDDAARIDGLGHFGIYTRIVLPLIKPVLATIIVLTFQFNWGEFFLPFIYIRERARAPLALALQMLRETASAAATPDWHYIMAGSVLLTLPTLLIYFFSQKYIFEADITGGNQLNK